MNFDFDISRDDSTYIEESNLPVLLLKLFKVFSCYFSDFPIFIVHAKQENWL